MNKIKNKAIRIEIGRLDADKILGSATAVDELAKNTFCQCQANCVTTLVNYEIILTANNDIILQGICKHCGQPAARFIEVEGITPSEDIAKYIRKVKENFRVTRGDK